MRAVTKFTKKLINIGLLWSACFLILPFKFGVTANDVHWEWPGGLDLVLTKLHEAPLGQNLPSDPSQAAVFWKTWMYESYFQVYLLLIGSLLLALVIYFIFALPSDDSPLNNSSDDI